MPSTIEEIANFTIDTSFADLPADLVHQTKRLLLDSFGCALAGVTSEKGQWALNYARLLFAGEQAHVLGFGDRLSLMGAAFVNAELINGLDYDAAGRHVPPFVIPAALAAAEKKNVSGADFILSCVIAHEISIRIGNALGSHRDVTDGKVQFPKVAGHSAAIFGGVAGVAKVESFDVTTLTSALGLGGHMSPGMVQSTMIKNMPPTTAKYVMAGWISQAALSASYLAQAGHRGDKQILDHDWGYWRFTNSSRWDAQDVLHNLGSDWRFVRGTPMKLYPCCRIMHGALDCLAIVLKNYQIRMEEIDSIEAFMEASCVEPIFNNPVLDTQVDAQFNVAFNLAVLSSGLKPGASWQSATTLQDTRIHALMKKIRFAPHPEYVSALKANADARMSKVIVHARGKVFSQEQAFIRGTSSSNSSSSFSDSELIEKFMDNAASILPRSKAERACALVMELENVTHFAQVLETLRL